MEVTLISRYFDTRNQGIGSYSKLVYDSLNQNSKVNTISEENGTLPQFIPYYYEFWCALDLKLLLSKKEYKNSDVFHSLSPLESLHIPKNKSVSSILDFIPYKLKDSIPNNFYARLFDKGIKSSIQCEKIVVLNSDLKNILISNYDVEESSIEIIPPPIDNKYHPIKKDNGTYVVGTISSLSKRKRIEILIESYLKAGIENSRLLIGGVGPELENLKKVSKGDERVKFLGFVSDEDMNSFYNSLDVFVFPTLIEGYGMPIVEAMACGKPVITLSDGDIPSSIKEKTSVCTKEELPEVLLNRSYNCNLKKNIEFSKKHSIKNIGLELLKVYDSI